MNVYKITFTGNVEIEAESREDAESEFVLLSGSLKNATHHCPIDRPEILETEDVTDK